MKAPLKTPWILSYGAVLLVIAVCAAAPWFQLHMNMTASLPGHLYLVDKTARPQRGDVVAFHWKGGAGYRTDATFLKLVYGTEGDTISVNEHDVYVSGRYVAHALERSRRGTPMQVIAAGTVPGHQMYVGTPTAGGFDSRYAVFGTIGQESIIGKAYALF